LPGLPLLIDERVAVVRRGHAEADFVVLASRDQAGERDPTAGVQAETIDAGVTEAGLAEDPDFAPKFVLVHDRVADDVGA